MTTEELYYKLQEHTQKAAEAVNLIPMWLEGTPEAERKMFDALKHCRAAAAVAESLQRRLAGVPEPQIGD